MSSVPRSGLSNATRRMKPKYATIIAMVREMAIRQRAAETALRASWCEGGVEWEEDTLSLTWCCGAACPV
jgi:hypothetical protein